MGKIEFENEAEAKAAISGIGDRIKTVRRLFKFSQAEFAERIGLQSHIAIFRYEKGLRVPDLSKIQRIAAVCFTTSKWLLTGIADPDTCDRIIKSIQGKKLSYSRISHDLDIPTDYFRYLENRKIDISADFLKKYCDIYEIDKLYFADIFMERTSLFGYDEISHISIAKGKKTALKIGLLEEINQLLLEDIEAQKIVLKILRSRKKNNAALSKLEGNQEGNT